MALDADIPPPSLSGGSGPRAFTRSVERDVAHPTAINNIQEQDTCWKRKDFKIHCSQSQNTLETRPCLGKVEKKQEAQQFQMWFWLIGRNELRRKSRLGAPQRQSPPTGAIGRKVPTLTMCTSRVPGTAENRGQRAAPGRHARVRFSFGPAVSHHFRCPNTLSKQRMYRSQPTGTRDGCHPLRQHPGHKTEITKPFVWHGKGWAHNICSPRASLFKQNTKSHPGKGPCVCT